MDKSRYRRLITGLAIGSAIGVGMCFLMRRRSERRRLLDESTHLARRFERKVGREFRHAESEAHGAWMRMHRMEPKFADGRVLLDRVESELFEDRRVPHGKLSLEVEGQTVVLRGALESEAEISLVENLVRRIPGVVAVRSFLHLEGTPAPNKVAALQTSERWPYEPPPDVDAPKE